MIAAFADLLAAEGSRMLLTDAVFFRTHSSAMLFPVKPTPDKEFNVNEKLTDARIFSLLAQRAQLRGVNRARLIKTAVEQNNAGLLEEWEELPPVFRSSSKEKTGREEILNYIGTILQSL